MSDRVLRLPEVKAKTGLSRSTIYELMKSGSFPRSFKLAARSVGWSESHVDKWIDQRSQTAPDGK